MYRGMLANFGILLCTGALGVAAAYGIAHAIQLKEGKAQLREYAVRLVQAGEMLAQEDTQAIAAVTHDGLPFCSDQELEFMRDYVFRAPHIRDLGRTKDGKLYCSTGVGRLREPLATLPPDIAFGGLKLYVRIPLMISAKTTGFVVEQDGVSLVLNPDSIDNFDEPPKHYTAMLHDQARHRLVQTYGPALPLSATEVLAGKELERNGTFYVPLCSRTSMVCQVAIESRAAMLDRVGPLMVSFLIGGALLGGALGLIVIQFYLGQRSMENQLRRAIRKKSLTVVYQPIVCLETGEIVGAEALARWTSEDGHQVRPEIFVALAEEQGFVGQITRLVAQRVGEELGDLLAKSKLRVTLNIASQDLTDPGFFSHLEACLAASKVKPASIGLELTERSTADHKTAVAAMTQFKNSGHVMYIDDFGTGYSSLAYLHELHVDAIKMDRAFTRTVGTEAVTASVVPQILDMAAQLDLQVVVEGIETNEQAEYFRSAGRGILGQGWLFGKPVPAPQFRKLLQR
jgi:sensor c-di-GMP phosphodiesterase-like protein